MYIHVAGCMWSWRIHMYTTAQAYSSIHVHKSSGQCIQDTPWTGLEFYKWIALAKLSRWLCSSADTVELYIMYSKREIQRERYRERGRERGRLSPVYLDVLWQQGLVNDSSLLEEEHGVCQLVGIAHCLLWTQPRLCVGVSVGEGGREK